MKRILVFLLLLLALGCEKRTLVKENMLPVETPPPVVEVQESKVVLSWIAPTTYTTGQALSLSEIGGYKIYYGEKSAVYNKIIDIQDSSVTTYEFIDLMIPTYFVITCYTVLGVESKYSNEAIYKP
jgi:hypothetical protein